MEKMINKELVKSLRIRQAWSQEQLAEVSGLSLRTIQRIEKDGKCSLESIRSLCSVLDLNPADLVQDDGAIDSDTIQSKGDTVTRHFWSTKFAFVFLAAAVLIIVFLNHQVTSPLVKQITFLNQGSGHKSLETYSIDFNDSSVHKVVLFDGYWLEATEIKNGETQYLLKLFSQHNELLHQAQTSLLTPVLYKVCDQKFEMYQSPAIESDPSCPVL